MHTLKSWWILQSYRRKRASFKLFLFLSLEIKNNRDKSCAKVPINKLKCLFICQIATEHKAMCPANAICGGLFSRF